MAYLILVSDFSVNCQGIVTYFVIRVQICNMLLLACPLAVMNAPGPNTRTKVMKTFGSYCPTQD